MAGVGAESAYAVSLEPLYARLDVTHLLSDRYNCRSACVLQAELEFHLYVPEFSEI